MTYVKNFDYIKDEPLINLVGRADTIEEAMEIVDLEQVLVLNMDGHEIESIVYDKNNTSTCITVEFDSGCTGNLYVCYKNDDKEMKSAFAVLEYHENFQDYFLVIQIDLYGEI